MAAKKIKGIEKRKIRNVMSQKPKEEHFEEKVVICIEFSETNLDVKSDYLIPCHRFISNFNKNGFYRILML
jgi:hypothetical protein